jgi:hypothetical protein
LAQQAQWSAPRLGFAFDGEQKSVRPILGYPGAALLGAAWKNGVEEASISPDGQWVLCRLAEEAQLFAAANAEEKRLSLRTFQQVAWSRDSRRFAALAADGSAIDWYELTANGEWLKSREWALAGKTVRLLALEAENAALWFAGFGDTPGLFYLPSAAEVGQLVLPGAEFSAFAVGSRVYWTVDSLGGRILRLTREENEWKLSEVHAFDSKRGRISALAEVGGVLLGAWTPAAGEPSPRLMRFDAEGNKQEDIELDALADALDFVNGPALLRLQKQVRRESPILLYEVSTQKVFFVPVPPAAERPAVAGGGI